MRQPGLDPRHRDKNGEVARKHGDALIGSLRKTFGQHFAPGVGNDAKLSDILQKLDEESLRKLIRDTQGK
jgi:hypothetical protein